jgi:hypothetical protein
MRGSNQGALATPIMMVRTAATNPAGPTAPNDEA